MSDIQQLETVISSLTLLEAADLVSRLEKRLGVSAQQQQAVTQVGVQPVQVAVEEKTEFTVILKEIGVNKINVIKAVREVTNLGLNQSKDLVDGLPKTIKDGLTKDQAENIKKKFTEAGATVVIE